MVTGSSGRETAPEPGRDEAPLAARRAFVVQFRDGTEVAQRRFVGRVEHVSSGQAATFQSVDELLAFIEGVLVRADGPRQE